MENRLSNRMVVTMAALLIVAHDLTAVQSYAQETLRFPNFGAAADANRGTSFANGRYTAVASNRSSWAPPVSAAADSVLQQSHIPFSTASLPSGPEIRRLPSIELVAAQDPPSDSLNAVQSVPVDGTWREDGHHILINLNGEQLRLERIGPQPASATQLIAASGGEVNGRLSHRGRPLVNCRVALLPLTKEGKGYNLDGSVDPLIAKTDGNGIYQLANVPAGSYKLSWLPEGQRQWIRRIEIRPDLRVRDNETSHVKEIRVALRTIN